MSIVFFDVDGTIWDKNNFIPDSTVKAISLLREKGHHAIINTGRSKGYMFDDNLLKLGFDGTIYGCGTHITLNDEDIYMNLMSREELEELTQLFYDRDMPMVLEGPEYLYMDPEIISRDEYGKYLLKTLENRRLDIKGNNDIWRVNKLTVVMAGKPYRDIIENISYKYYCMTHGDHVMEIVNRGHTKATGIDVICEKLKIKNDDTYAIGDSSNDIDMLDHAGHGIVMGNGTERTKLHAEYVTASLLDDGIYKALKHYKLI